MATKLTITVPDDLAKRLEPHREHMNISRICAEALEADLNSREAHLASLVRYEEFKKMRSEAEAMREQMMAQAGRGWQKLAQDMQRLLKEIGREIEQLEKQIPEEMRMPTADGSDVAEREPGAEKPAPLPEPALSMEHPADAPEPKPVAKKAPRSPEREPVAAD